MENYVVPRIEDDVTLVPPKEASEKAFYATMSYSQNLVDDYLSAKADLEQTGKSAFVDSANERWAQEQDAVTKQTISEILVDQTIDPTIKKGVLQGYALTGYVSTDLKDKYVSSVAAKELGVTEDDRRMQDLIIDQLDQRVTGTTMLKGVDNTVEGTSSFLSDFNSMATTYANMHKASASVLSQLAVSLPAGLAGVYKLIKDRDPEKASILISNIIQEYAYTPKEQQAQKMAQWIGEAISYPGQIVADKLWKYMHDPKSLLSASTIPGFFAGYAAYSALPETLQREIKAGVATIGAVSLDPLNFVPAHLALSTRAKGIPTINEGTPAKVTEAANPIAAEKLGEAAIKDTSGRVAEAIGADRGAVAQDWVLPKPMSDKDALGNPDLRDAITKLDETQRELYDYFRYDPNIIQATRREEEVARIKQIQEEMRGPYYRQADSKFNETDNMFEFKSVYGRKKGGYTTQEQAESAAKVLEEKVGKLPEEERGTISIESKDGQFYVVHQNRKVYDDMDLLVFGPDSIKATLLGFDASALARSPMGKWIFGTGRLPEWVQKGAARSAEKEAVIKSEMMKVIRDNISGTKYGKELNHLIDEGESQGIEYFTKQQLSAKFPNLSKSDIDALHETHIYQRRLSHYAYNWINREQRNIYTSNGMKGIYSKDGNYVFAGKEEAVPENQLVWDMDTGTAVFAKPDDIHIRVVEQLDTPQGKFNYARLGTHKVDMLPTEVVNRVPGWSPRRIEDNFFIQAIPNEVLIDGKWFTDLKTRQANSRVLSSARTEAEANKIKDEFAAKEDYTDYVLDVRPERQDNFGQVMTDYGIHQEFFKHSMQRGEKLPYSNYEDRLHTLISTVGSLAKNATTRAWDEAFRQSFTKAFPDFLTEGKFPQYATDITPTQNMGREAQKRYKTAHELFKYYERVKNTETLSDFNWNKFMWAIADVLEKFKIPANFVRKLGKGGFLPLKWAKQLNATLFITLSPPPRQWLVQTAQQWEMMAVDPVSTAKSNTLAPMLLTYYAADSSLFNKAKFSADISGVAKDVLVSGAKNIEPEFVKLAEAIRKSGLLQAVDLNTIVHGVFRDANRALIESGPEAALKEMEQLIKKPIRAARGIGFDVGELQNRLALWIQQKEVWAKKNPDKDWASKEAVEQISYEAWRLSGHMSRAGMVPYQEGVLSAFFQFAAISHHQLINLLSGTATNLTPAQRWRIAGARLALTGTKYGIPGGYIAHMLIDENADSETKAVLEPFKRGMADYAANNIIARWIDPNVKSDLEVSKILSPYSEHFLPYFDIMVEAAKIFDGTESTNPRFPFTTTVTAIGRTIDEAHGWFITRKVNDVNEAKIIALEAAELSSMGSNYSKAAVMLGHKDQITKFGNQLGMQYSMAEVYARLGFGIGSGKEMTLYEASKILSDIKSSKKEIAKDIHIQLMNMRTKVGEKDFAQYSKRLNSFISILPEEHFSQQDKMDIVEEVLSLDRRSYIDKKQSIMMDVWSHSNQQLTEERKQAIDVLSRNPDPSIQAFIKEYRRGSE